MDHMKTFIVLSIWPEYSLVISKYNGVYWVKRYFTSVFQFLYDKRNLSSSIVVVVSQFSAEFQPFTPFDET